MSFFRQLKALVRRNILLKKRNRRQLFQEIIYPIYFFAILLAVSLTNNPDPYPQYDRPAQPANLSTLRQHTIVAAPNTTSFTALLDSIQDVGNFNFTERFATGDDLVAAFRAGKGRNWLGLVFTEASVPGSSYDYVIRTPYDVTPGVYSSGVRVGEQVDCYSSNYTCNGQRYLSNSFTNLQFVVDTAIIKTVDPAHAASSYSYQLLPVKEQPNTRTFLRTFASIYAIIAFSPFIAYLVMNLVVEKEKKIKILMQMMGLRTSALWLSWLLLYLAMLFLVCILLTALCTIGKVFLNGNFLIFFLILFLYSCSIVTMGMMLSAFFKKGTVAGAAASLFTILFSVLYLADSLTRDESGSKIPVAALWLLCLVSPFATSMSIDRVTF